MALIVGGRMGYNKKKRENGGDDMKKEIDAMSDRELLMELVAAGRPARHEGRQRALVQRESRREVRQRERKARRVRRTVHAKRKMFSKWTIFEHGF